LTILYRQRRMEFRVVWTKKLKGCGEYQVGLEAVNADREGWGLSAPDMKVRGPIVPAATAVIPEQTVAQNPMGQL
jgi:hypothetical protein